MNRCGFIEGEYEDGGIRGIVFVVGRRGMGKTTLMVRKLNACLGGAIFFDTLSKHASVFPGWRIVTSPDELAAYLRLNRGRRYRVLYQPKSGDIDKHFANVCRIVRAIGWMILGIDELDKLCGPRFGDSRMPQDLYHLVNYGRHERVSMIATARRPRQVPRGITAEAEVCLFNIQERADVDYFADLIGEEVAGKLRGLPKFSYLTCGPDGDAVLNGGD